MRITAARVTNFKRVRDIEVKPDADRIILIGGNNAQGKSSLLDALTVAFGGKRAAPADPVRHGADESNVDIELDGGDLTIHRVIEADGESKLEVREKGSVIRSPQARLDRLVGARFLDPIAFLQLSAADQRAQLLAMFDRDGAIAKIEEHRERVYQKRTEVGRDLKKAQGELARVQEVAVGTPIDVAALSAERAAFAEQQRKGEAAAKDLDIAQKQLQMSMEARALGAKRIADLERELQLVREAHDGHAQAVEKYKADVARLNDSATVAAATWKETSARREQLDADLSRADEHNRAVFEAEATNKRRAAAAATVKQLEEQYALQTEALAKSEQRKLDVLAAAKLPVGNLGISTDGITLNDVPFTQASAAERLRVALALAMAASPGLDDVWIRDGALLDDDSLQLIAEQAEKAGKRCWVERVGDRDPGAIVIQDGTVRSEVTRAAG